MDKFDEYNFVITWRDSTTDKGMIRLGKITPGFTNITMLPVQIFTGYGVALATLLASTLVPAASATLQVLSASTFVLGASTNQSFLVYGWVGRRFSNNDTFVLSAPTVLFPGGDQIAWARYSDTMGLVCLYDLAVSGTRCSMVDVSSGLAVPFGSVLLSNYPSGITVVTTVPNSNTFYVSWTNQEDTYLLVTVFCNMSASGVVGCQPAVVESLAPAAFPNAVGYTNTSVLVLYLPALTFVGSLVMPSVTRGNVSSVSQIPPGVVLDTDARSMKMAVLQPDLGIVVGAYLDNIEGSSLALFSMVASYPQFNASVLPPSVATVNQLFTFQPQWSSKTGFAPRFCFEQAPVGMVVDSATGFISWTPTFTQFSTVVLRAELPAARLTFTIEVPDVPLPMDPLVIRETTTSSLTVSWTLPFASPLVPVLGFELWIRPSSSATFSLALSVGPAVRNATLGNLESGVLHELRARARNSIGQGLFSSITAQSTNIICSPGSYLPLGAPLTGPCVSCEADFFVAGTTCSPCPSGTTSPYASPSLANCTCQAGLYEPSGAAGTPCQACPLGAVCPGGTALPEAAFGFFPSTTDANVFLACPNAKACVGGTPFRCAKGYADRLCSGCAPGYYHVELDCLRCQAGLPVLVILLLIGLGVFLSGFLIWMNTRESLAYRFAAFVIGFNSLQVSALFGRLDLSWPPFARTFFNVLSFVNFNLDLAAPECTIDVPNLFAFKWAMTMMLPLFFVLSFVVCTLLGMAYVRYVTRTAEAFRQKHPRFCRPLPDGIDARCHDRLRYRLSRLFVEANVQPRGLRHAAIRAYWQLLGFVYMPLTLMSMLYFKCARTKDGLFVMAADATQSCYDRTWYTGLFFAVAFSLLYAIGIPLGIVCLLKFKIRSRKFNETKFAIRYGFLVGRYTPPQYLYETKIMAMKFGVVFSIVFISQNDYVQASGALWVLVAALVHMLIVRPYRRQLYNGMAVIMLLISIVVLWAGTNETMARSLRAGIITAALIVQIVGIIAGNAYDIRRMLLREREDMADFADLFASRAQETDNPTADSARNFKSATGVAFLSSTTMSSSSLHRAEPQSVEMTDIASLGGLEARDLNSGQR